MDRNDFFDDLTRNVLARTSGSACPGAQENIAPLVDGALPAGDEELTRMHVAHCCECDRILETVTWLASELPTLAEVDPGYAFTRDVMAATAERRGWIARWAARLEGMQDAARALLARPRLPLEGAYIGAMLVWLVFFAPFSPLNTVPEKAARLVRVNPGAVAQAAVIPVPSFLTNATDSARDLWSSTEERLQEREPGELTWRIRLDRAGDRARSLGYHGLRMTGEALRGNFSEGGNHYRLMGDDAKAIWRILAAPDPKEPSRPRPTTFAPQRTAEKEA